MISASEWKAYNDGISRISDAAEKETERRLLAWHALNPDATVAEAREYAKEVMAAVVRSYDGVAASFAAEWYDYRAERGGARLDQAMTSAAYSPETADEVARYQAKKLAKGDFEGFAKACGEYARNDALRSLNETIMANAKRDRKKGVRFARVPTGLETCTFCLMLASRGAVYHTRKTAGEFKHFHRRCDCKVVPGFEDDPDAELVEGFAPLEMRRQWWAFEKIDATEGVSKTEAERIKRDYLDGNGLPENVRKTNPSVRISKRGNKTSGWLSAATRLNDVLSLYGYPGGTEFYRYLATATDEAEFIDRYSFFTDVMAAADATKTIREVALSHLLKSRVRVTETLEWEKPVRLSSHAKKHGAEFGLDFRKKADREAYDELLSDTVNNCDRIVVRTTMAGQEPDRCAFYIRGERIAVVNVDSGRRVSLFTYKEGYSAYYDSIWAEAHNRP